MIDIDTSHQSVANYGTGPVGAAHVPQRYCRALLLLHCAVGLVVAVSSSRYDQWLVSEATIFVSVLCSSSSLSFSSRVFPINIFHLSSYLSSLSYNFC